MAADGSKAPDAGAPEITIPNVIITAAMIDAGVLELAKWDYVLERDEEAVVRIFRAMIAKCEASLGL